MEMKFYLGLYPAMSKNLIFVGEKMIFNFLFVSSEVATDEVDHLFASTDDDHDDRLSYKEIIDNYDIFVGSEVTDYGDYLQNIHKLRDEL